MPIKINAGRISVVPQGEWSDNKQYYALDQVSYQGNCYTATQNNINQPPPGAAWEIAVNNTAIITIVNNLQEQITEKTSFTLKEEDLSSQADGNTLIFTISKKPKGYLQLYFNGQRLVKGKHYTYDGNLTITLLLSVAPDFGDTVLIEYDE